MGEENVRPAGKEADLGLGTLWRMVSSHCDLTDWYLQTAWGLRAQLDKRAHTPYLLLVGIPAPFVRRPGLPNSARAIRLHARKELSLTMLTVRLRRQALTSIAFFQVEDRDFLLL